MNQQGEPHIQRLANTFLLDWPSIHMGMHVSRIQEHSERTTAEFWVRTYTDEGEAQTVLRGERYNLVAPRAKKDIARRIADRFQQDSYFWETIIESAFETILEEFRSGEPVQNITGSRVRVQNKFRVHPLLLEQQPNVIFGKGGSGKSLIATYIAVIVDTPPLRTPVFRSEGGGVLYLDWETDVVEFQNRVAAIKNGLDIPESVGTSIKYLRMTQPLEADIDRIQGIVMDEKVDLIVVDSMEMAIQGNSNESMPVSGLYAALRTLGTTSLIIDHLNKSGEWVGNEYKRNFARNAWRLAANQIPNTDLLTVGFFHEKWNNTKRITAFAVGLTFTSDETDELESVTVKRGDIADIEEFQDKRSLSERLYDELKDGPQPLGELAQILDKDEASVRTTLHRNKNRFVRIPSGDWALLQVSYN